MNRFTLFTFCRTPPLPFSGFPASPRRYGHPHLLKGLPRLRFLVIDEADRMVQKGSYQELAKILEQVRNGRRSASAPV